MKKLPKSLPAGFYSTVQETGQIADCGFMCYFLSPGMTMHTPRTHIVLLLQNLNPHTQILHPTTPTYPKSYKPTMLHSCSTYPTTKLLCGAVGFCHCYNIVRCGSIGVFVSFLCFLLHHPEEGKSAEFH